MASLEELARRLTKYGITYNEARVYIAAAKLGTSSIIQISKSSNVAREEVYRLSSRLEALGLIEKTLRRPTKIKATDLRTVLSMMVSHKKEMFMANISNLEEEKEKILADYIALNATTQIAKAHITVIRQRLAIYEKMLSMINSAKKLVCLSLSKDQIFHIFSKFHFALENILRNNIVVHIILDEAQYDDTLDDFLMRFKQYRNLETRFTNKLQTHYLLIDNEQALLSTSTNNLSLGNKQNLWSNESSFTTLLKNDFDVKWMTSKDIISVRSMNYEDKLKVHLNGLQPTEHSTLIYKNDQSKYKFFCNFCKIGLENGEAVFYIGTKDDHFKIKEIMINSGIDVTKYEKANALHILPYTKFYLIDGKFNRLTTCNLIKQFFDDAIEKGFIGCRIFGDMSCFFQHNLTKELIAYEKSLHTIFDVPIIAICAYNSKVLGGVDSAEEGIKDVLKTHSKIFFMDDSGGLEKISNI